MERMKIRPEDALQFHMEPAPGKWEITATVPMTTQRDLSLAYSPGVAEPVRRSVALKILKSPADSKQVLARFEAERQARSLAPGLCMRNDFVLPFCRFPARKISTFIVTSSTSVWRSTPVMSHSTESI